MARFTLQEQQELTDNFMERLAADAQPLPTYGEIVVKANHKDTYDIIYDYSKLKMTNISAAQAAFYKIETLEKSTVPTLKHQLETINDNIRFLAYENLLLKKYPKNDKRDYDKYEPLLSNPTVTVNIFDELYGEEADILFDVVKSDFFYRRHIFSEKSIQSLTKLMPLANQEEMTALISEQLNQTVKQNTKKK